MPEKALIGRLGLARGAPRKMLRQRRETLRHVSQMLRVVPWVPALEVVAAPLLVLECDRQAALDKAAGLLGCLGLPGRLWAPSPTTFSGGERQGVNIARRFARRLLAILSDESTTNPDTQHRETGPSLFKEAKGRGAVFVGICHDNHVHEGVCDRAVLVSCFAPGAIA